MPKISNASPVLAQIVGSRICGDISKTQSVCFELLVKGSDDEFFSAELCVVTHHPNSKTESAGRRSLLTIAAIVGIDGFPEDSDEFHGGTLALDPQQGAEQVNFGRALLAAFQPREEFRGVHWGNA